MLRLIGCAALDNEGKQAFRPIKASEALRQELEYEFATDYPADVRGVQTFGSHEFPHSPDDGQLGRILP
jgi:hypothetical protein